MTKVDIVNLLVKHPTENKLLAVKRSATDNTYGGMWALPGGAIEQDETERETAERELNEETGLTLKIFDDKPLIVSPLNVRGKTYLIGVYSADVENGVIAPKDPDISKAEYIETSMLIASLHENKYPEDQIVLLKKFFENLFITLS